MGKKSTKSAAEKAAERLSNETVSSINGWKAVAITKFHDNHPLAWSHGADLVEAVRDLEAAYLNILGLMEHQIEEYENYGKSPASNN